MADKADIEAQFWSALKADKTMMIGLDGVDDGHTRPMAAQVRDDEGPIWFFTSADNALVQRLQPGARAIATFVSRDHDLFASVHGAFSLDQNRAVIDELWNPYVAAWYEGGKDDPNLRLLRLDPDKGEIWLGGTGFLAGLKMLVGMDPEPEFRERTAKVQL